METMVQADELLDVVHNMVRIPQCPQALTRHVGTDDLMVVKRNALRPDPSSFRFPDVVKECGKTKLEDRRRPFDHCERVVEDILVPVNRILLEFQRAQLRKKEVGQTG
jgi:hypothetical protein